MQKIFFYLCFAAVIFPIKSYSWDGYDSENQSYIEIEQGNLVRSGNEIEIYDYSDDSYKTVDVQSITRSEDLIEIEVYDSEKNTYRTFEME